MLIFKVFVINLERSPDRLARIKKQLDEADIAFERIAAIDGAQLTDEFIEQVSPSKLVASSYHRALSKGEVACALSHKSAWQKIIDDDLDFAIVLEDDIYLEDNFSHVVNLVAELPYNDWDFFKLYPLTRRSEKNILKRSDYHDHSFITYDKFPLGCQGQVISRQGAKALVEHMPYIVEPVDSQLKSWWEVGIFPFGLLPYCVSVQISEQSDINPDGGLEQMKQNRVRKLIIKWKKALFRLYWSRKLDQKFEHFIQRLK